MSCRYRLLPSMCGIFMLESDYQFLDYSKPSTAVRVTALVPAPRLITSWFTPLYPFSLSTWMAILLVLIFDAVVLSCLFYRSFKRWFFGESIMMLIQLYLLQSIAIRINGKLMKYFILLNMMNVLLLCTSYSSGLSSVMTVPRYERIINTVEDLALSGLAWGGADEGWIVPIHEAKEDNYETIVNSFVIIKKEEELSALSKSHNFGFPIQRLNYGYYALDRFVKSNIISNYRVMEDDIYAEFSVLIARKNTILLPLLDDFILRVFEAGLGAYRENKVMSEIMDMSVQKAIRLSLHNFNEHGTVKLQWGHVGGAFAILLIGYIASSISFLLEIAINSRHLNRT